MLRLRGEHEVAVAPLTTPSAGPPADAETIGRSASARLLVARARQVRPDFTVTPDNAAAVAELCRRLDGIPLALELAAAQLRLLTPATLLRRLGVGPERSLDLAASAVDTPDRQRTLRATIQWSYSLLSEAERRCSPGSRCSPARGPLRRRTRSGRLRATSTQSTPWRHCWPRA